MKQIINYQDNIFFIHNLTACLEDAMQLDLYQEFTGSIFGTLVEKLHLTLQGLYGHLEVNSQLKDQNELLRLCALAGAGFTRMLKQLGTAEHSELLQSNNNLTQETIKSMLVWHEEKSTSLMMRLSNEGNDTDKQSGLSSDELSGLLG